jgi:hypothetical protein
MEWNGGYITSPGTHSGAMGLKRYRKSSHDGID